jgi:hypothetical protein
LIVKINGIPLRDSQDSALNAFRPENADVYFRSVAGITLGSILLFTSEGQKLFWEFADFVRSIVLDFIPVSFIEMYQTVSPYILKMVISVLSNI